MTRSVLSAALAALFAAGAAAQPPGPAPADTAVGRFHLRRPAAGPAGPLAIVFPEGERGDGAVMWTCAEGGGVEMGVRLVQWGARRKVLLRFDDGAADTLRLRDVNGLLGRVEAPDAARLAARARAARRMTLRPVRPVEPARPGAPEAFSYDLAGAAAALDRLGCAAGAGARGRLTGYLTLKGAAETPWLDPNGRLTNEPSTLYPRVAQPGAFMRALERGYPPEMRDAGIEGRLEVVVLVLPDGRVDSASARIRRSSNPAFDSVALAVMRRVRFAPGRLYGRPVSLWVSQPIRFTLADEDPAPPPRRGSRSERRTSNHPVASEQPGDPAQIPAVARVHDLRNPVKAPNQLRSSRTHPLQKY